MSTKAFMNFKETLYFIHNIIKATSLIASCCLKGVAMHWIADPKDLGT